MSFSDFDEGGTGVHTTGWEQGVAHHRYGVLGNYARPTTEGRFSIPVARTLTWNDWREAVEISITSCTHGKLVLMPEQRRCPSPARNGSRSGYGSPAPACSRRCRP